METGLKNLRKWNRFLYLSTRKDSSGLTIKYEYDVIGNRIGMITPEGKVINYTYDSNNRLTGIDSWLGRFDFEYDSSGRRIMLTYPNGLTTTYSY